MELAQPFNVNEHFYKKIVIILEKPHLIKFLLFKKKHIKLNLDDNSLLSIINFENPLFIYIYIYI